jgi:hypothetical protein
MPHSATVILQSDVIIKGFLWHILIKSVEVIDSDIFGTVEDFSEHHKTLDMKSNMGMLIPYVGRIGSWSHFSTQDSGRVSHNHMAIPKSITYSNT